MHSDEAHPPSHGGNDYYGASEQCGVNDESYRVHADYYGVNEPYSVNEQYDASEPCGNVVNEH